MNISEEERIKLIELKTEFDNSIDSLELNIQKAEREFNERDNMEGHKYLERAYNDLKGAFNTLKEIVLEFRRNR